MDPVTIVSLVALCVTSSASLYKTIDSLKSRKQDVRHLKTEVGDLNIVLQALAKNIEETTENFEVLRLILEHCGQACKDFEEEVLDNVGKSDNRLEGVRAWAKLQLKGGDIDNFRKLIGSYKATLTIALADANLRTVKVTKQLLEKYSEMTQDTTSDLEDQIAELSQRLDVLQSEKSQTSPEDSSCQKNGGSVTTKQTLEQKASLEQCLIVCHQLLDHIEIARCSVPKSTMNATSSTTATYMTGGVDNLAPRLTADALQMCTHSINAAAQHLQDLQGSRRPPDGPDGSEIMQQLDRARQCLDIVGKAQQQRVNVFENIDTAEDSFQTIVSTIGDLIRANGLTIGARAVNIMGQMNDDSLQKITCDLRMDVAGKPSSEHVDTTFEKKHGFGHTIQPKKPYL
ncbi:hypothetical protein LTR64_003761 [Lithohypha guttulata]|uniref:uncharacterized protein n=1 Tax=Lithohypha guttulata TaxID=1690604 RepID=UPI002DE02425|nr:hypothetical protein LTR51_000018 [Lithohypha guttulata]